MTTQTGTNALDVAIPDRLDVQAPIHDLLAHRWSPRALSDRPVESGKLLSLLEAARWAPSSANEQPWRFVIAAKKEDARVFSALAGSLTEANLLVPPSAN